MTEPYAGIEAAFAPPLMRAVIVDNAGRVVRRQAGVAFDVGDALALGIAIGASRLAMLALR
jgi:hypothetical protein